MGFTLLWGTTKLSADDLPDMVENEVRKITVKAAGVAGSNTISGTPTATSDTLTVGTVTKSTTTLTFNVTASQTGTHYITLSAVLSSGETVKAYIRVRVRAQPCPTSPDYDA